jgi:hypothetical protein
MPYFQRKPIEGLIDIVRSPGSIPGLPSRGAVPGSSVAGIQQPGSSPAAMTGIVEQAAAVLDSERPRGNAGPAPGSAAGSATTVPNAQIGQLQQQANDLIEQLLALTGGQRDVATTAAAPRYGGQEAPCDDPDLIVEPAPVLSPSGPVAPGATAQIWISLVNEDDRPAQIAFFSTGLIGNNGEHIPAERISCQPREIMLPPGKTGEVTVRVVVPAQTPCGVYSGLIRASKLDYLHAVLVVQVEAP